MDTLSRHITKLSLYVRGSIQVFLATIKYLFIFKDLADDIFYVCLFNIDVFYGEFLKYFGSNLV